jgi:WD40 repeat protein
MGFTRDGQLLTIDRVGTVMLHGMSADRTLASGGGAALRAALSPKGDLVAWVDGKALHVRALAADDGLAFDRPLVGYARVVFSDGGRQLVFANSARVWSCDPRRRCDVVRSWPLRCGGALAATADGDTVAASTADHRILIFDGKGGLRASLDGEVGTIEMLVLTRDGQWVAAAARSDTVRLWNVATGRAQRLWRHELKVSRLVFAPDGSALVSASHDSTVRVFDMRSGDTRVLRGQHWIVDADVLPDSSGIVSVGEDRTIRLWPLHVAASRFDSRADLDRWLAERTSAVIDHDGMVTSPK